MSRTIFNLAAKCDAAGRSQNQDNYWVCPDLAAPFSGIGINDDTDVDLSAKGALLVVADGMGGMKSGELASEFVVEGLKKKFRNLPDDVTKSEASILQFVTDAVTEADKVIKEYASAHRESEGMGSTIALAWLLGDKAYCVWCGDSRIYCYNPQNSLVRLSHDHSYVQRLVDEGKISADEAFDHPDSNIITRSLGDNGESTDLESRVYPLHRRDVLLLCSDGLCGLLDDKQLESIISEHCTSSKDTVEALWQAGEKAGWSDNATIEVACITESAVTPTRKAEGYPAIVPAKGAPAKPGAAKGPGNVASGGSAFTTDNRKPGLWERYKSLFLIIIFMAIAAAAIVWFILPSTPDKKEISDYSTEAPNGSLGASEYVATVDKVFSDLPTVESIIDNVRGSGNLSQPASESLNNFLKNVTLLTDIPADLEMTKDLEAKIEAINRVRGSAVNTLQSYSPADSPNRPANARPAAPQRPGTPAARPHQQGNGSDDKTGGKTTATSDDNTGGTAPDNSGDGQTGSSEPGTQGQPNQQTTPPQPHPVKPSIPITGDV